MRKQWLGAMCGLGLAAGVAHGQGKLGLPAPVTYTNRYEGYLGLNLSTFQAGQTLAQRMNLGGVEAQGTMWLTPRYGVAADVRGEAGTTPVFPNQYNLNRVLVYREIFMGGVQVRGPRNQYAAVNLHAFGGGAHGVFDQGVSVAPQVVGLYTNRTSAFGAVGGSLDINRSARLALRVSPEITFERFGTETREFFTVSGGVVYRFGQKRYR